MTAILTLMICFGAAALGTALVWLALRGICWVMDQAFPGDIR